jgi:hypothetical protein
MAHARLVKSAVGAVALLGVTVATLVAQTANLPNPYREDANWAKLPADAKWAGVISVDPAANGDMWVFHRSDPPVMRFDPSGKLVTSFGTGMIVQAHGMTIDRDGNVWVTDAQIKDGKGNQVLKFSRDGKLLMALGKAGVAGSGTDVFSGPCDVAIAANGDIFVADGHIADTPVNRIMKFSKDGKFIKAWGKTGYAPGEFRVAHCINMDKRGRLFVCDRSNARIQIFDQDGKFLARWYQFGMPSGIAFSINDDDLIYVFDSESDNVDNPGFEQGIRIGDAQNGWVKHFILDQGGNPATTTGSGPEFGSVDKHGNVFAGEPRPRVLRKYVKVR